MSGAAIVTIGLAARRRFDLQSSLLFTCWCLSTSEHQQRWPTEWVDKMHTTHKAWISDKKSVNKVAANQTAKRMVQEKTPAVKEKWWADKVTELQQAADLLGLKTVFGPCRNGFAPLRSKDGQLLAASMDILNRWTEHFSKLFNQPSSFDKFNDIPQITMAEWQSHTGQQS